MAIAARRVRQSRRRFLPPSVRPVAGRVASRAQNTARALVWLLRPPTEARHIEWTALVDAQDDVRHPASDALMRLAIDAAARAEQVDLSRLADRAPGAGRVLNLWPGEHYRFLAALVEIVQARLVVEVGTYTGMSSLAMASAFPPDAGARVVTFDVEGWASFPDTLLRESDLTVIEPRIGDLSDAATFEDNRDVFAAADLVFLDGPKDGRFEPALHPRLQQTVRPDALVVYDDIRMLTMVELWRSIATPKFDATSLAHWTGTGLVRFATS